MSDSPHPYPFTRSYARMIPDPDGKGFPFVEIKAAVTALGDSAGRQQIFIARCRTVLGSLEYEIADMTDEQVLETLGKLNKA